MVISPVLRGLFGLEWNAETKTLMVTPHLPAAWDHATIRRLPFGAGKVDLTLRRQGTQLLVQASDTGIHLASHAAGARMSGGTLAIPLAAVEAGITEELPEYGAETGQMKPLSETYAEHSLMLGVVGSGQQYDEVRRQQ